MFLSQVNDGGIMCISCAMSDDKMKGNVAARWFSLVSGCGGSDTLGMKKKAEDAIDVCRVPAGGGFDLKTFDPSISPGVKSKAEAVKLTAENLEAIALLQQQLYAEGTQALLVVLQGIDAAGKDGTIRKVFSVLNPQGTRVKGFKVPSEVERKHDFLWRIHQHCPQHGEIGIFNRSHYEDVLVVRVHDYVPKKVWSKRYSTINQFERMLTQNGTRILKFFLYIDEDEQLERFQARLDEPNKRWKFSLGDLEKRKYWNDYIDAFGDAINKCSTKDAPWVVVPANRKWYRNWLVSEITRRTLEEMNPQFPDEEEGLEGLKLI